MNRSPADWMGPVDDRILEFVEQEGPVSLRRVHGTVSRDADVPYNRAETANRMERLLHYRLVSSVDRTRFYLTDFGSQYLDGNLEADGLRPKGHPHSDENRPTK